ncbi:MAG: protein kinase [Pedosphaera sp.]|nr:protein kinase [Pedosphaera sp.]
MLRAICHALEFAHSRGVLHRDVKTHNVMVRKFGEVYIMDCGIAIRTQEIDQVSDGLVGTPGYLAPEMLSGKARDVNFQTDVFLVGATLHTILTGQRRNNASTVVGALDAAKHSEPYSYDQDIPPTLGSLANRACAKNRSDRLGSVTEFRETIEKYLALREAFAVRDRALEKKELLEFQISTSTRTKPSANEIRQHFTEAKFGLEQALQMAPGCEGATEGLQEIALMMINWLLQSGHLDEADHLIANLPFADTDITSRITSLRHAATRDAAEVDYLKKIAPEYDPTVSRVGRVILGGTIMAIVAVTSIAVIIYDTLMPAGITPARRLVPTGSVALIIVAALFFARRWLFINQTGGRLASSVVFGFCCAPLFAIAGLKAGFSGPAIMVGDTLIVGLAMANAYPVVRTGRWAAAVAVVNVLVAAVFPSWAHGGFMISTAFAAACIVYDWITRDFRPSA